MRVVGGRFVVTKPDRALAPARFCKSWALLCVVIVIG